MVSKTFFTNIKDTHDKTFNFLIKFYTNNYLFYITLRIEKHSASLLKFYLLSDNKVPTDGRLTSLTILRLIKIFRAFVKIYSSIIVSGDIKCLKKKSVQKLLN